MPLPNISKKGLKTRVFHDYSKEHSFSDIIDFLNRSNNKEMTNNTILVDLNKANNQNKENEDNKDYSITMFSLINHNSILRKIEDFIVSLIVIYTITVFPVHLTFFEDERVYTAIELLNETLLFTELISNFFTTFNDQEENLITNRIRIAKNYLSKWFVIDLISSFPFEFITYLVKLFGESQSSQNVIFCLNHFKWIKLSRFSKLFNEFNTGRIMNELVLSQKIMMNRIIKFLFIFITLIHVFSCFFIYLAKVPSNPKNWVTRANIDLNSYIDVYFASLYYIFSNYFIDRIWRYCTCK